jgi:thiol-disulfide isomerase/thioredoxin
MCRACDYSSTVLSPALSRSLPRATLVALGLCGLLALFWPRGERSGASAGRGGAFDAPGGFLIDGLGRPSPLGERMADATLLHFWATWCAPCLTEIPAIQTLRRDLEAPGRFHVVLVAVADSPDKVKTFLGDAAGAALYDPKWEVAHRYGTEKLPESYLVVRGRVIEKFAGATDWDDPQVRARLAARLEEAGVATAAKQGAT